MNVAEKTITKVKQEFEMIMLDIKVTYVNMYINEPIKTMA